MIAHPTWRSMFYQLAEQYPDCLMLNFTIKVVEGYSVDIHLILYHTPLGIQPYGNLARDNGGVTWNENVGPVDH